MEQESTMTGLKLNSFVDFRMAGRKIRSVWMGDSHLMEHHHLPGYFFDGLLPNPDLHKYYRGLFGSQKSGAKMDKPLKDKIYDLSHKYKGEATLFVIQAGSNNFRGDDKEKDPKVTVDKLLADYKELKDHFLKQKSQALIVTSVIPDKKPELAPHFAKINTSLRLMFNNAPEDKDCRLHYVDFVGKHLPQKEDGTFYDKALYQDALHLNEAGAKLFAKELVHKLTSVANRAYGRKHLSNRNRIRKDQYLKAKRGPPKPGDAIFKLSRGKPQDQRSIKQRLGAPGNPAEVNQARADLRARLDARLDRKVDLKTSRGNKENREGSTSGRSDHKKGKEASRQHRAGRERSRTPESVQQRMETLRRERNRAHQDRRRDSKRELLEPRRERREYFYQNIREKSPETIRSYVKEAEDLIDFCDDLERRRRQDPDSI